MDNNSTSETSNIPKSSSTLAQPRKNPVFVTLQKIGTGFTFVRPSAATASQIPQRTKHISSTSLLTTNKVALANPGKTLRPQTPVSASPYDNNVQHYNTTIQQKKQQPINQIDTVIPTISITTKKALNRPNNSRKPSIAASSITISKQKSIKKTCKYRDSLNNINTKLRSV
ncbi:uncharacterized protein LOC119082611 [Bradysia coprophila]|uniref:uncharacterized protein LOC119082611 n=1 Tax=Bradysia coprophila TaxID=38358 RepID=UPI00187D9EC4|nr:uncharacterized protein LOC119082611 [Bradysia coprophila]